ncbi:hypothetical protein LMH87_006257 [Akanthomyces muscarius]|uniref:Uncharacterized protein n=1 Tax=Akanthomyces muscarius TaxID=2231603 RepID=A0A9W8USZ6_AKAMU|nr:hypothetical protein LMH87_006257 [Akanthomyces muscarius]KAJ4164589.1 hypothetical protein LMH87_006257 [Akanthomyces muscarius]
MEARRFGRLLTQHDWVAGENGEADAENILEQVVKEATTGYFDEEETSIGRGTQEQAAGHGGRTAGSLGTCLPGSQQLPACFGAISSGRLSLQAPLTPPRIVYLVGGGTTAALFARLLACSL